MRRRSRRTEQQNFHTDFRVQGRDRAKRFREHVDLVEAEKIALVSAGGMEVEVPFDWEVCSLCGGDGSVTDPSIDAGGISAREMHRHGPEFRRSYERGDYDIDCPKCKGRRVEPNLDPKTEDQQDVVDALRDRLRRAREIDQTHRAERAMGA